jgi:hypothetical protein
MVTELGNFKNDTRDFGGSQDDFSCCDPFQGQ